MNVGLTVKSSIILPKISLKRLWITKLHTYTHKKNLKWHASSNFNHLRKTWSSWWSSLNLTTLDGWRVNGIKCFNFGVQSTQKTQGSWDCCLCCKNTDSLITELPFLQYIWTIFSCSVRTTLIWQRLNSLSFLKYFASFKRYSHFR